MRKQLSRNEDIEAKPLITPEQLGMSPLHLQQFSINWLGKITPIQLRSRFHLDSTYSRLFLGPREIVKLEILNKSLRFIQDVFFSSFIG